jgi:hypothetical protein
MLDAPGLAVLFLMTAILSLALYWLCRWSRWTAIIGIPAALGWLVLRLPDIACRGCMGIEDFGRTPFIPEYIASFVPILFLSLGFFRRRPAASNQSLQPTAGRSDM